ncbi:hypothetical protein [Blattabacterium cuenoti]
MLDFLTTILENNKNKEIYPNKNKSEIFVKKLFHTLFTPNQNFFYLYLIQ